MKKIIIALVMLSIAAAGYSQNKKEIKMKNAQELLNEYLTHIQNPDYIATLFAADGAIELPYLASLDRGWRTEGKENIKNMISGLLKIAPGFGFKNIKVHIVTPNQVFAEYEVETLMNGMPYKQLYMGRLEAENGKIKLIRESMDLVAVQKVFSTDQDTKTMQKEKAIDIVKQNTMLVQGKGDFELFDKIFADDYTDHTPQKGGFAADKEGTKSLYKALRQAFPDFHAVIHWQICDGDMVTTYKTYYGTHKGTFLNVEPTNKKIEFIAVDVMRVQDGKITDHWGVGDLLSLYKQLDLIPILKNK